MTFAETVWKALLDRYSHQQLELFGNLTVATLFFWIPSAIYLSLPYILSPNFVARRRLQKQEKQPTPQDIWECFWVVLRNQLFLFALHIVVLSLRVRLGVSSSYRFDAELPSRFGVERDLTICVLGREALFYYIHRALHHPSLYARIHKRHHRFTAPIALAAQYASLTEHILANTLPVVIPLMLLHTHIVTVWLFLAWTQLETSTVHSGFALGKMARRHDAHHEKFNIWFGYLGIFDRLHGTDGTTS